MACDDGRKRIFVGKEDHENDRCGKLSCRQGPEFAQAGHGLAPGNPLINPHAHPPDKSLGPLRRSGDCRVDEVPHDSNNLLQPRSGRVRYRRHFHRRVAGGIAGRWWRNSGSAGRRAGSRGCRKFQGSRIALLAGGAGIKGGDVGEESLGELGVEQRALGHHFSPNLTFLMTGTKCSRHAILRGDNRNPSNSAHYRRDFCHGAPCTAIDTREGRFFLGAFHTGRLESRGTGNPQENPTSQGRPHQGQQIDGIMNIYLPSGTLE